MSHTSTTTVRRVRLDRVCAEAVELARSAAEEAGEGVGAYIGAEPDADRVVSHYFECTLASYRGWRWVTVLMRAPRSRNVTVAETALLPGADALIAPQWVPWSDRLRAGDVGVGDLLPTDESDERLMPAYTLSDDDGVEDLAFELGVGRTRVMSREGRAECAERWYEGPQGPNADISKSAPADARCGTCGFYLPLAGSMRQIFGVCGNVYAADDASVVSADHGCGAHSEVLSQAGDVKPKVVEEGNTLFDDSTVDPVSDSREDEPSVSSESDSAEPAEISRETETGDVNSATATETPDAAGDAAEQPTATSSEPEVATSATESAGPSSDSAQLRPSGRPVADVQPASGNADAADGRDTADLQARMHGVSTDVDTGSAEDVDNAAANRTESGLEDAGSTEASSTEDAGSTVTGDDAERGEGSA